MGFTVADLFEQGQEAQFSALLCQRRTTNDLRFVGLAGTFEGAPPQLAKLTSFDCGSFRVESGTQREH